MKITYFYQKESEKEYFSKKLDGFDLDFLEGTIQENPEYSDKETEILSVFVKSEIGAEELDRFPNLKFIATRSTGFNHIDLEETEKRGIIVSNVPVYGENTVAEFAFSLILALSRKVCLSYDNIKETGNFSQENLQGFDLKDKTIGIIGAGNIGRFAIKIAKGFNMNVVVFDVNKDEVFAKEIGFEYVDFDTLLETSDIISLHVPLNPHTQHLINEENIRKIKKGAYLINTSRGEVVDTDALVKGLESNILAGAGIDVLEEENFMGDNVDLLVAKKIDDNDVLKTLLENQYLIDHPRVIITPHNAFNTVEAVERIYKVTYENIKAFEKGDPLNFVKNK